MVSVKEIVLLDFLDEVDKLAEDLEQGKEYADCDSYCYMVDQLDIHYRHKEDTDDSLDLKDIQIIMNILDNEKGKKLTMCYFDVIEYLENK